jgi:uncharacterized protein DUF4241
MVADMLERVLTNGAEQDDYVVAMVPAGEAALPTGRVVGCDPLSFTHLAEAFTVRVPPGRYPLRAWMAIRHHDGTEIERHTAALQLVIRDERAVGWEQALLPGQDPARLADNEFFAYPVDTGTGTLADETALRALTQWTYERVEAAFVPAVSLPPPATLAAVTDRRTGANVVLVSAGRGEGSYPTFIGRTGSGEVACFVTTFSVLSLSL